MQVQTRATLKDGSARADALGVDVDRRLLAYWKAQRAARARQASAAEAGGERHPDERPAPERETRAASRGGTVALMLDDR